jgi:hypothetical protein
MSRKELAKTRISPKSPTNYGTGPEFLQCFQNGLLFKKHRPWPDAKIWNPTLAHPNFNGSRRTSHGSCQFGFVPKEDFGSQFSRLLADMRFQLFAHASHSAGIFAMPKWD